MTLIAAFLTHTHRQWEAAFSSQDVSAIAAIHAQSASNSHILACRNRLLRAPSQSYIMPSSRAADSGLISPNGKAFLKSIHKLAHVSIGLVHARFDRISLFEPGRLPR